MSKEIAIQNRPAVPGRLLVPSALLIFLVHTNQIGVGLITYTRFVHKYAKKDGWLSIIIAGLAVHVVLFCICRTLRRYADQDLFSIHVSLFGKWLGRALNTVFMLYMFGYALTQLLNYYSFISAYLFPEMPIWIVALFMLTLVVYGVFGGIRVVVGISLLSFLLSFWIVFVLIQSFEYTNFRHFLPLLEESPRNILMGAYETAYTITGFEILFFLYPYVSEKEKAHRYAQTGAAISNSMYLYVMILTIAFYSAKDLSRTVWPALDLFKVVSFPFLEQFEVIVIMLTMLIILPNMCLYFWVISKGMKRYGRMQQRTAVWVLAGSAFVLVHAFHTHRDIAGFTEFFNQLSFLFVFVYPICLYGFSFLAETMKKRRRRHEQHETQ